MSAGRPVVGIDGCRGRWLVVRRHPGRAATAELVDDLAPLVDALRGGGLAAVAVDMPIGILDGHPRACDVAARRLLGPRRSSVFPAPVRAVLDAADYDEARSRSRAAADVAPSVQAFNLVPAIVQLDALVEPDDQDLLVEAHPELAFARLAAGEEEPGGDWPGGAAGPSPLDEPKRTAAGRRRRRDLLVSHDPSLAPLLDASPLPVIDLLDAAVLTVTAERVVAGTEHRLGDDLDRFGRRAEIVW